MGFRQLVDNFFDCWIMLVRNKFSVWTWPHSGECKAKAAVLKYVLICSSLSLMCELYSLQVWGFSLSLCRSRVTSFFVSVLVRVYAPLFLFMLVLSMNCLESISDMQPGGASGGTEVVAVWSGRTINNSQVNDQSIGQIHYILVAIHTKKGYKLAISLEASHGLSSSVEIQ